MKKVIITGTSQGIGYELTKRFSEDDQYQVLALSRNIEPLKKLELPNVTLLSLDLTDTDSFDKVVDIVKDNWGSQVDIVIHNAGALIKKDFQELVLQDYLDTYSVNVFSVALLTQKLLPFFRKGTHTVAISSIGGVQRTLKFKGLAAYSSSKSALNTLMELLAETYQDEGYVFNVLALGAVQTQMLEKAFPGYKATVNPKEIADYIYNFAKKAQLFHNGKIIEVSSTTP